MIKTLNAYTCQNYNLSLNEPVEKSISSIYFLCIKYWCSSAHESTNGHTLYCEMVGVIVTHILHEPSIVLKMPLWSQVYHNRYAFLVCTNA